MTYANFVEDWPDEPALRKMLGDLTVEQWQHANFRVNQIADRMRELYDQRIALGLRPMEVDCSWPNVEKFVCFLMTDRSSDANMIGLKSEIKPAAFCPTFAYLFYISCSHPALAQRLGTLQDTKDFLENKQADSTSPHYRLLRLSRHRRKSIGQILEDYVGDKDAEKIRLLLGSHTFEHLGAATILLGEMLMLNQCSKMLNSHYDDKPFHFDVEIESFLSKVSSVALADEVD